MRTTVTLDPTAEAVIRRLMAERGIGFKEAINSAIVESAARPGPVDYVVPTFDLGPMLMAGDKALALAADLEDQELLRKMALGK